MAIKIDYPSNSGRTLFASIHQLAGAGVGDTWNVSTGDWASGPAVADAKVTLTEQSSYLAGAYFGEITTTLGTYTGDVLVLVHDDTNADKVIGSVQTYLSVGDEQSVGNVVTATVSAKDIDRSRMWFLRGSGEYSEAPEIIKLTNGTTATLSMAFGKLLNPGTDLSGTPTVVVDTVASGTAPAISNASRSQDSQDAHADFVAAVVGKYKIKVTATTTDSQTFTGFGWLHVN